MTSHFKNIIKNIITHKIIPLVVCSFVLMGFFISIKKVKFFSNEQNQQAIERTINEAIVSCYAIEGKYPKDIQYLEENYNLYINHDKYLVDYDIFASNIMPEIVVIDKSVFE